MLERTAVTLEPCNLHKVLPSVPRSSRSRRHLHTAFWNHGAASVELFDACQAILGGDMEEPPANSTAITTAAPAKGAELMTASAFLLDFLYPRGTLSLLRKLNCNPFDRYEKSSLRLNNPLARFQVATLTNTANLGSRSQEEADADFMFAAKLSAEPPEYESASKSESKLLMEKEVSDLERLKKSLSLGSAAFPDHVWHLYKYLRPELKDQYTMDVLRYLSVAPWIPEPQAFCHMVSDLDAMKWSQELVKAAIKAALSFDDLPLAISFFNQALGSRAWPQGFDLLLAHCLTNSLWDELLGLWDSCRESLLSDNFPKLDLYTTIKIRDLSTVLSELWEHIRSISYGSNYKALKNSYDSLLRFILTNSMEDLAMDDAVLIVKHLSDPVHYEELIKLCSRRGNWRLASELYMSYRKLPDVNIRIPVLREMLDIFYPNDEYGMEMVLKDWYGRYKKLDYIAYRKFICFYAGEGDVASVGRLWKEYKKSYKSKSIADRRVVRALIDVHAVRGDVAKARAVFDKVTVGHGRRPDIRFYNMLLSAHGKAWDLDGALETFTELCEHAKPNNYSFGYLMNMTGSRGNVQLTLGLYKMARGKGIAPDVAMVNAIVEAYCQSDRMASAENLCNIATKRRVLPDEITFSGRLTSPCTIMWNTVLRHYAVRYDLTNVNRILEQMAELKISYDGKTYEYLLLALVLTKQATHALKLVELAEENGIFSPSAEHYYLLMSGYLATREPAAVMKISKLMTAKNYPDSAKKMTKLMEAFGQWAQLPSGARLGRPAHFYLDAALKAFRKSLGREDRTSKDDIHSVAEQYSKMINILTQMREFATIPEIISLYEGQFPEHTTPEAMPLKLISTLMRADFYENKFDRVMDTWNVAFDRAMALREHPTLPSIPAAEQGNNQVAPAHRYLLNEPLATVLTVYSATGDVEGLVATVTKVLDAGFALSARNWNVYIQMLARFGRWMDAFVLCEKVLMPQWPGWAQRRRRMRQAVRLPLDLRRLGKSYRYARPNTHTLLMLIRQFMELERLAPWSSEPAALVEKVTAECPRFVRAAKTMMPTGSDLELDILGKESAMGGEDVILGDFMKEEEFRQSDDEAEGAY
ncbi:hypothetical protein CONLIGDRAFT_571683 [Coniochaeta ligniaria NRRL 30616]|uniref:Pentacotripeptide-repeat region of PRORP domain-containing protein n=1 Tax=Coniochaeta ligniaria NRRL 30616 TaxID=1408157 RepID=A0A1J7IYD1_9PEZI|nr:hypothetical protein CONLIGDRAFT_571683 [Coniochaeta ligniaria NRRL 30616]